MPMSAESETSDRPAAFSTWMARAFTSSTHVCTARSQSGSSASASPSQSPPGNDIARRGRPSLHASSRQPAPGVPGAPDALGAPPSRRLAATGLPTEAGLPPDSRHSSATGRAIDSCRSLARSCRGTPPNAVVIGTPMTLRMGAAGHGAVPPRDAPRARSGVAGAIPQAIAYRRESFRAYDARDRARSLYRTRPSHAVTAASVVKPALLSRPRRALCQPREPGEAEPRTQPADLATPARTGTSPRQRVTPASRVRLRSRS